MVSASYNISLFFFAKVKNNNKSASNKKINNPLNSPHVTLSGDDEKSGAHRVILQIEVLLSGISDLKCSVGYSKN